MSEQPLILDPLPGKLAHGRIEVKPRKEEEPEHQTASGGDDGGKKPPDDYRYENLSDNHNDIDKSKIPYNRLSKIRDYLKNITKKISPRHTMENSVENKTERLEEKITKQQETPPPQGNDK